MWEIFGISVNHVLQTYIYMKKWADYIGKKDQI